MTTDPTGAGHEQVIARWKASDAGDDPVFDTRFPHPAGDVMPDVPEVGAAGIPKTYWQCVVAGSALLSCVGCDTTIWKGTCWASTVGCCPTQLELR